jgi:hypothetical protein
MLFAKLVAFFVGSLISFIFKADSNDSIFRMLLNMAMNTYPTNKQKYFGSKH